MKGDRSFSQPSGILSYELPSALAPSDIGSWNISQALLVSRAAIVMNDRSSTRGAFVEAMRQMSTVGYGITSSRFETKKYLSIPHLRSSLQGCLKLADEILKGVLRRAMV